MEQQNQNNNSKQLATISQEKLLRVFNPKNCLKYSGKLKTLQDVINANDTPSLSKINKTNGEKFLKSFVMTWVLYLNESLNLKRPLNESQIEMVSDLIISDYGSLKITDITFIFKNAISGKYGEFYESLSIPKIMSWFSEHFEQRCEIAEMISNQQHNSYKTATIVKWDKKIVEELFKETSDQKTSNDPVKFELPEYLESSEGYKKSLTEMAKNLSVEKIKELIESFGKHRSKSHYIDVLENELNSRK
jgi:hypothetical protein